MAVGRRCLGCLEPQRLTSYRNRGIKTPACLSPDYAEHGVEPDKPRTGNSGSLLVLPSGCGGALLLIYGVTRSLGALVLALRMLLPLEASADSTILNVSYDPTRRFYAAINKAFAARWLAEHGEKVRIYQ